MYSSLASRQTQHQGPEVGGLRFPPAPRLLQGIRQPEVGLQHQGCLSRRIFPETELVFPGAPSVDRTRSQANSIQSRETDGHFSAFSRLPPTGRDGYTETDPSQIKTMLIDQHNEWNATLMATKAV